jgi:hypothetical protein
VALLAAQLRLSETKKHFHFVYLTQLLFLKLNQEITGVPADSNLFLSKLGREWWYLERAHKTL